MIRFLSLGRSKLLLVALATAAMLLVQASLGGNAFADGPEPVNPGIAPRIITTGLSISTDTTWYFVGQQIRICYRVPTAGFVQIRDEQRSGTQTLRSGYDDGRGDCFYGTVTPPFGNECVVIQFWYPWGGTETRRDCFTVYAHS